MKKTKNVVKGVLGICLLTLAPLANADWTASGGYIDLRQEGEGLDISLGAIYASVGYEIKSDSIVIVPELRLGRGITDDTVLGVNVEVDSFFAASIRGQYNVTDSFSVFLQPSYARLEATVSGGGQSITEDDWEFGFGGGASFKMSESFSLEAIYESFDGSDFVSFGARYSF